MICTSKRKTWKIFVILKINIMIVCILVAIAAGLSVALYISVKAAVCYKNESLLEKKERQELQDMILDVVNADIFYRAYNGHEMGCVEKFSLYNLLKETNKCSHKYLKKYKQE